MAFDPFKIAQPEGSFDPLSIAKPEEFDPGSIAKPTEKPLVKKAAEALTGRPLRKMLSLDLEGTLENKKTIGRQAEEFSERQSQETSNLVPGVPITKQFENQVKREFLEGRPVEPTPGIKQRADVHARTDSEFFDRIKLVGSALETPSTEEQQQGILDTVKRGGQTTLRSVGSFVSLLADNEDAARNFQEQEKAAIKNEKVQEILRDIDARVEQYDDADWAQVIKSVGNAFADDPVAAAHLVAEQTPNSILPLVAGGAGFALGGVAGGIAGLFGGNIALETGFRNLEKFGEESSQDILKKGAIKGSVIGAVDTATIGLTSYIMNGSKRAVESATRKTLLNAGVQVTDANAMKVAVLDPTIRQAVHTAQISALQSSQALYKRLIRGGAGTVLESLGEGFGDYFGSLAADGEASKVEAVIEAFSSVGSSAVTAGAVAAYNQTKIAEQATQTEHVSVIQEEVQQTLDNPLSIETDILQETLEPIAPLTPEEVQVANIQEKNLETDISLLPDDPSAVVDITGLKETLENPVFKQPEIYEHDKAELIQEDMDAGVSADVTKRRLLEEFPDAVPMEERRIGYSTVPEQLGLSLTKVKVQPDSVVAVGGHTEYFSSAYTHALGETLNDWRKEFMPIGERIILNLSGFTGDEVGAYKQLESGIHVISPRELPRSLLSEIQSKEGVTLGRDEGNERTGFNSFTQQQALGGLTHEVGHAVLMSRFGVRMPSDLRNIVGKLDSGVVLSPEQLATIPEEERAVVQDFQDRKERILSGEMNAQELMNNWLGHWKQGKDLLRKPENRDLERYAKERLQDEVRLGILEEKPFEEYTALQLIHAMGRQTELVKTRTTKDIVSFKKLNPTPQQITESNAQAERYLLQFSEFMAEQFSRYAATKDIQKGTALGRYFAQSIQALKQFFKSMKTKKGVTGESVIKPGTSFEAWMRLGYEPQVFRKVRTEKKRQTLKRKTEKRKIEKREKRETEIKETPPQPTAKELLQSVIDEIRQEEAELAKQKETRVDDVKPRNKTRRAAQNLELAGDILLRTDEVIPDNTDPTRLEIEELLRQERYLEADEMLTEYIMKTLKFDKDSAQSPRQKASDLYLDKDSVEAKDVEKVLEKIGEKAQASIWKKAINWTKDAAHYVLQIQQLAHQSTDKGTLAFNEYQNALLALKNNMLQKGTQVADQWEHLSKRDDEIFTQLLLNEYESGRHFTTLLQEPASGKWKHAAGVDFIDYMQKHKLNPEDAHHQRLATLVMDYKNSILEHIDMSEKIGRRILQDKYRKAPLILQRKLFELQESAQKWREAPYMPQGNFGEYVVKVYDNTPDGRKLIYKTHFESAVDQDAMVKQLKARKIPIDNISWERVQRSTGLRANLPAEFLGILKDTGEFSEEQLKDIGDLMIPISNDRIFSKFARDAVKIAGASTDHLRNYANWIEGSANFLSKLSYGREMTKARAVTRQEMQELKSQGLVEEARGKQKLYDTMTKAQEFILNPLEDWYRARSYIALTYLMWAPKTALLNLTGMFQTWAAVTADYGDIKGHGILASVTKDLMTNNFSFDEKWVQEKALTDGIIDQGFGYFMSGLANAGNLARRVRPTLMGKALRGFVDLGMWPFKAVEIANRQVTLMSVYRAERDLAIERGLNPEEAMRESYKKASRYTRLLQNDYANGNRPEVLRGKKSILMIFLSYPQYMLWIMSGGFERGTRLNSLREGHTPRSRFGGMTMRLWLMFALMAGAEGVPFGETMINLIQKMYKWLGGTENLRIEGHKILKEAGGIEDRYWRDVIQRGFLHDVLGVDLAGSLSLGAPLPGLRLINSHSQNWQEFVGEAFSELAGPFAGVTKAPLALGHADELTLTEFGKAFPGAAGSVFKAADASVRGIRTNQRARIIRDDEGNFREPTKTEIALIASGFRLSEVARYQNLHFLQRERINYWAGRRTGLKKQYRRAHEENDRKLEDDVLVEIDKYNQDIPTRQLFLSRKELMQFVRTSRRDVQKIERGITSQKNRNLVRDVKDVIE